MNTIQPQALRKITPLLILLLIGLVLRLLFLGEKTIWADEGAVWYMALGEVEHEAPPIYQYFYRWSIGVFGWNEFAGRFPSALFGWLSVIIIYYIGSAFLGRRIAFWSAALAAISAFLVPLSQDMRIYSIVGFETLLALLCFLKIIQSERTQPGWWIGLLIVGIIGQNSHCFFILVLGYWGFVLLAHCGWQNWRKWTPCVALLVLVMLLSSSQIQTAVDVTTHRQHIIASDWMHLKYNVHLVFKAYFTFLCGYVGVGEPGGIISFLKTRPLHLIIIIPMVLCWLFIFIFALRYFWVSHKRKDIGALVLKMLAGMMIGFTLLYILVDVSSPGHLIFVYIPVLFLFAAGLAGLNGKNKIVMVALLLVLTGYSLVDYYRSPTSAQDHSDWRSAGETLRDRWQPGDGLLILASRNAYYTLKFYYPELEGDIFYYPRHDPELLNNENLMTWWEATSTLKKVDSLFHNHQRVWLVDPEGKRRLSKEAQEEYDSEIWPCGVRLKLYLIHRS
jgi:4-amino-4-deoxy-L-arabinose transferase-like glycosyltransferase